MSTPLPSTPAPEAVYATSPGKLVYTRPPHLFVFLASLHFGGQAFDMNAKNKAWWESHHVVRVSPGEEGIGWQLSRRGS